MIEEEMDIYIYRAREREGGWVEKESKGEMHGEGRERNREIYIKKERREDKHRDK